jgi:putative thioredoxin
MSQASITETTPEQFDKDVIEQSFTTTVVVDFWAAWCGPCRRLAPLLERLAEEQADAFKLVKADVDQLPQQAASFGVQGIPAVYAVRDGKVIDSFTGLLTEVQLREWLTSILPTEAETCLADAARTEAIDLSESERLYRQAIMLAPQSAAAKIGLARVLQALGDTAASRTVLSELEARGFLEPEAEKLKAQLEMESHRVSPDDLAKLRAASSSSPQDMQAKLQLAEALLASKLFDEGLQAALEIVEQGKQVHRDAARTAMVDTFRVLGDDHPLTKDFRRQLSVAIS